MNDQLLPADTRQLKIVAISCVVALSAGCVSNSSKPAEDTGSKPAAAATPAAPAVKSTAGMDAQGDVIDPSKVESGSGQQVKVG